MMEKLTPSAHMSTAELECGWIAVKASEAIERIKIGQVLEIACESKEKEEDVELWLEMTGHELLDKKAKGGRVYYYVKRTK
jgi:TusA-related sulfurtransferase